MTAQIFLVFEIWPFFQTFFQKCSINLDKKILNTIDSNAVRVLPGVASLASIYDCSSLFYLPMTFWWFFQKFWERKFKFDKKFHNIWYCQPCNQGLSRSSQELSILPPNKTAQILLACEIWRFFEIFQNFQKKWIKKFFKRFRKWGFLWVLSELADLAYKCECWNHLSFEICCFYAFSEFLYFCII